MKIVNLKLWHTYRDKIIGEVCIDSSKIIYYERVV